MLAKLEGYATALLGSLDATVLETVVRDLASLEQTTLARADLRAVLTDTSISATARGHVIRELLTNKVDDTTLRLAVYAASAAPAQEVPHALGELAAAARSLRESAHFVPDNLGLLDARRRVGGFADALLETTATEDFAQIEEELFRWARVIEAHPELRRLLVDRDAPLASRLATTDGLLAGKVSNATLRLARYVIEGGRPRDVVGTLDFLVDFVARVRNWRVARVQTARPLSAENRGQLVRSLAALTGTEVELRIAEEPSLLSGVVVEVGDLLLDASTRGRLSYLHDAVASGHFATTALHQND